MTRSASRLLLVLIAAAAIAMSVGGFSWDGTANDNGSGTPGTAVVGSSADSSGSATVLGFSWDDGTAVAD